MTLQLITYERNGGPLENSQVDRNWLDLEEEIKAVKGGAGVESWEKDPDTGGLVIRFTDGQTVGPISFPPAKLVHEGEYTPGKIYDENDIFTHEGSSYLVSVLFQAKTWAQDKGSSAFGLLAAASTGLVDAFKDWPEDDVTYGIRNRQRVAIDLSGGGGGGAPTSTVWDWMPPREAEDGAVVGFFRASAKLRYSYTLPTTGVHTSSPVADYDLEVSRSNGTVITTLRYAGGSVSEVGTPNFGEIGAGELVYVSARQPGASGAFKLSVGLSIFFSLP